MVPLIILLGTLGVLSLVNKFLLGGKLSFSFMGRAAMSAMLLLAGIAHFIYFEPMVAMMPDFIPWKLEIVYFTGVCEFLAAAGLLWDKTAKLTSVMLIIFFVAILPANIMGSLKGVNIPGAEYGIWYLLFRVPLQIFFIWWVWYFGISQNRER
ncbi:MAG: hypothetical protein ABIU09_11415, partial [Pyrinomonadaceae bacterium]